MSGQHFFIINTRVSSASIILPKKSAERRKSTIYSSSTNLCFSSSRMIFLDNYDDPLNLSTHYSSTPENPDTFCFPYVWNHVVFILAENTATNPPGIHNLCCLNVQIHASPSSTTVSHLTHHFSSPSFPNPRLSCLHKFPSLSSHITTAYGILF